MRGVVIARRVTTGDDGGAVRLVVDVNLGEGYEVEGQVRGDGCDVVVPFSGWLDFVRVLEAFTTDNAQRSGEPNGLPGGVAAHGMSQGR